MVGFMKRFNPGFELIKSILESVKLGWMSIGVYLISEVQMGSGIEHILVVAFQGFFS